MVIRKLTEPDIPQVLALMKELAIFEQYIDVFAITEADVREHGFQRSPPTVTCFVAAEPQPDGTSVLFGMLVYYIIPYTATATPTLFIKELFVDARGRGQGIGTRLMQAAAREACRLGCGAIKWQVANWNTEGRQFYEKLGAQANPTWIDYALSAAAIQALADSDSR